MNIEFPQIKEQMQYGSHQLFVHIPQDKRRLVRAVKSRNDLLSRETPVFQGLGLNVLSAMSMLEDHLAIWTHTSTCANQVIYRLMRNASLPSVEPIDKINEWIKIFDQYLYMWEEKGTFTASAMKGHLGLIHTDYVVLKGQPCNTIAEAYESLDQVLRENK